MKDRFFFFSWTCNHEVWSTCVTSQDLKRVSWSHSPNPTGSCPFWIKAASLSLFLHCTCSWANCPFSLEHANFTCWMFISALTGGGMVSVAEWQILMSRHLAMAGSSKSYIHGLICTKLRVHHPTIHLMSWRPLMIQKKNKKTAMVTTEWQWMVSNSILLMMGK